MDVSSKTKDPIMKVITENGKVKSVPQGKRQGEITLSFDFSMTDKELRQIGMKYTSDNQLMGGRDFERVHDEAFRIFRDDPLLKEYSVATHAAAREIMDLKNQYQQYNNEVFFKVGMKVFKENCTLLVGYLWKNVVLPLFYKEDWYLYNPKYPLLVVRKTISITHFDM